MARPDPQQPREPGGTGTARLRPPRAASCSAARDRRAHARSAPGGPARSCSAAAPLRSAPAPVPAPVPVPPAAAALLVPLQPRCCPAPGQAPAREGQKTPLQLTTQLYYTAGGASARPGCSCP